MPRNGGGPPRLAEWMLGRLLPPEEREAILGDLEEELSERRPGFRTRLWYWGQAALLGVGMAWARRTKWSGADAPRTMTGEGGTMGSEAMTGLWNELKVTARGLLRRPGYAALALTTLVLGVGSVTAGYGLLHQVVLRPLPYEETDRLVVLRTLYDSDVVGVTLPEYLEVAEHADVLESVAALVEPYLDEDWIWTGRDERAVLAAVRVTDAFFSTLGVEAERGSVAPDTGGGERRVVVSHDFWQQELGGDPSVVGRTMGINEEPYVIVGALPATFEFPLGPEAADVWILFTPEPAEAWPDMPLSHRAIGRVAPGIAIEEAESQLTRLVESVRARMTSSPGETFLRPLEEDLVGSSRRPLVLLAVAGGLVLLVAALNLSLLIAARNVERERELRVRAALGASRSRLLRHLLMEAGMLAVVGGGIAVACAVTVLDAVFEARPGGLARVAGGELGPEVILVGLIAAVVPAIVAAGIPALRIATNVRGLGSRGASSDRRGRRFAWMFSGVESGLVFVLLMMAGLVLQSLREVTAVDPGFDAASTVAFEIFPPTSEYRSGDGELLAGLLTTVADRLESLPGVEAVGTISNLPLSPESWSGSLRIDGREDVPADRTSVVDWELAGPGYFEAVGIPLIQGRSFDERDRTATEPVVVVNQTLASRWWPEGDAIGARISGGGPFRTVVGVVGDVKQQGLEASTRGFMYLPVFQMPFAARQEVVVRVAGEDPASVVTSVRTALLEVEPDLAFGSVRTMEQIVQRSAGSFRLRAILLGAFAAMALLLGMAGIYGITAHGVRSRRRDIGIRMAMGAESGLVMRGVLTEALLPVGLGLVGGLLVVWAVTPALRGLLFGVSPGAPLHVAGTAALLLASGAGAVLPSALRARRFDPAGMLREE